MRIPTCCKASTTENPYMKVSPFCPGATAEGMVGSGSATRFLTRKRGRVFYGSTVRVEQEQVLYLSAGGSSNRKEGTEGQKGVRKTNRAAKSGPCPKDREDPCTPRSPQAYSSLVEHSRAHLKGAGSNPACASQSVYGFRKENQLIVLQDEHAARPQADL